MNTTAAAIEARVAVATIRAWCRYGAVAAVKQAGRWVVDAASLARRVAIGSRRRKEQPMEQPPIVLTNKVTKVRRHIGVLGPAAPLAAAFEHGEQVTLEGKWAGERVYLGHTHKTYDDGVRLETIGLDREIGEHPKYPGVPCAVYLLDTKRLDDAPRLAAYIKAEQARMGTAALAAEERARESGRWIARMEAEEN